MTEIFSIKNIIIFIVIMNLIGFLAMGIDKRRAKNMQWRIPEKIFFLITLFGGGFGTIVGMYVFRHKTKKKYFTIGLPTILIIEIICLLYIYFG